MNQYPPLQSLFDIYPSFYQGGLSGLSQNTPYNQGGFGQSRFSLSPQTPNFSFIDQNNQENQGNFLSQQNLSNTQQGGFDWSNLFSYLGQGNNKNQSSSQPDFGFQSLNTGFGLADKKDQQDISDVMSILTLFFG